MFWLGLIVGLILGAIFGFMLIALLGANDDTDYADYEYLDDYEFEDFETEAEKEWSERGVTKYGRQ